MDGVPDGQGINITVGTKQEHMKAEQGSYVSDNYLTLEKTIIQVKVRLLCGNMKP